MYLHISVNGLQQTIVCTAAIQWEVRDQFIAACNGIPQWSTKEFVYAVREIEHDEVVSAGIFEDQFRDKHPRVWNKQALITHEETTEAYLLEVVAESHG